MALALCLIGSLALYLGHPNALLRVRPRWLLVTTVTLALPTTAGLLITEYGAAAGAVLLLGGWMLGAMVWPLLFVAIRELAMTSKGTKHV